MWSSCSLVWLSTWHDLHVAGPRMRVSSVGLAVWMDGWMDGWMVVHITKSPSGPLQFVGRDAFLLG